MKRTLMEEMILAAAKAMVEAAAKYDGENAVAPAPAAKKEKTEKAAPAAKKQEAEAVSEDDGDDLNSKTTKELYQMCVDAGLKVPKYGKNKQFYIAALNEANGEEAPADEQADDEYADMSAKELFDLCRKRGIKVQPKKKADVYIAALKKADAAEAAEDDDDDWGDEEDVEPEKPAAKPAKGKKAAKPKAEPEPEEDDDDDWDI